MRFKGWKNIFTFNYVQYVKTKAFIGSTVAMSLIFALIIACINIIPSLAAEGSLDGIFGGDDEDNELMLEKLYICNETQIPFTDLSFFKAEEIEIEEITKENFENKCGEIAEGNNPYAALLIAEGKDDEGKTLSYDLKLYRPEDEDEMSKSEGELVSEICRDSFKNSLLMSLGVEEKDLETAKLSISAETTVFGEQGDPFIREFAGIIVPMILSVLMFSFIISYAQIIAQSIAQEKTSRVIELLITSVRPLAIITGKVLAMLLMAVTQVAIIGGVCGLTATLTMPFSIFANKEVIDGVVTAVGDAAASGTASDIGSEIMGALPGLFNPGSIIAIIVVLILGFLFYALLAGLVGAGVSRSEDLAAALQPLMMVAMLGFFLSYMSAMFNEDGSGNIVMTISRYIPVSSPFALPSAILLGEMSGVETVISIAFLALLTALTALLVSKVYETIILYSGNPLKLGQILKMAKNKEN